MSHSKPAPANWPRISSAVYYDDAIGAIDWLCRAFGFAVRLKIVSADGHLEHSELTFGDGLIMVSASGGKSTRPAPLPCASPRSLGGINTQALCVCVDDQPRLAEHPHPAQVHRLRPLLKPEPAARAPRPRVMLAACEPDRAEPRPAP